MSKKIDNWWLISSGLLFGFYCLNVIVGKMAAGSKDAPLFSLGDVWEFVVLFAAVICLVITMLQRESQLEN